MDIEAELSAGLKVVAFVDLKDADILRRGPAAQETAVVIELADFAFATGNGQDRGARKAVVFSRFAYQRNYLLALIGRSADLSRDRFSQRSCRRKRRAGLIERYEACQTYLCDL